MIRNTIITFVFFSLLGSVKIQAQDYDPNATERKFNTVLQAIRYAYVDTVNLNKLVESSIVSMLQELDPHSQYISKEELQETNEPLEGKFEGVGIQFNLLNDTILVVATIPGGPSEKVGIRAGDKIIKINGEVSSGKKVDTKFVRDRLRGVKGSKVDVEIYRRGVAELLDFSIIRDKIPLNSVVSSYMLTKDIGYIKMNRFAQTSLTEFREAIAGLQKQGMKSLIFDLTGNPGGYLNVAIDIADEFLGKDKLVVYTEGIRSPIQKTYATAKGSFEKGKVVVLIDEGSASASEIVSGAVQDWDRGLVVGRRSYGKGLVQKPFPLPDGSIIRLTTARYHTPTGRCIQKSYEGGFEEYRKDLLNRFNNGEFMYADSINFPDSLKYYTPGKRVVYGGGGVMPDVFIPLDTTRISDYYSDLLRKGLISDYCLDYVDKHREELLKNYTDFPEFDKKFVIDETIFNGLIDYSSSKKVKADTAGITQSEIYMKNQMKALIASSLWNYSEFFRIFNQQNEFVIKAIEVIENDTFKELSLKYE